MSDETQRDYPLEDRLDAGRADRLKALADPMRMRICDLVLERAMSVTELAERVQRPKGTVAYHVDVLVEAGLLKVVRTRRVRALEERFYGRVARTYVLPSTPGELPFLADVLAEFDHDAMSDVEALLADDPALADDPPGYISYRRARVPVARLAEYSARLDELARDFVDEPRAGDIEFGLYVALFPTNRHRPASATRPDADPDDRAARSAP